MGFFSMYISSDRCCSGGFAVLCGLCRADRIFQHSGDRFAVDLKGGGTVEFHRDFAAEKFLGNVGVLCNVLALENGREGAKGVKPCFAVHDHEGNRMLGIEPVLIGSGHHAAAEISAVHGRRKPHLFKGHFLTVKGNDGVCGGVSSEKTFDGNGSVIYAFAVERPLLSPSSQQYPSIP